MSGAGAYGAGIGPAGFDPIADPTAPRAVVAPAAILFQLNGRDFPLDANGLHTSIHPVDQVVAIAVGVSLGMIGTSPSAGNRLRRITHVGAPSTRRAVVDAIRLALADKVSAGDISIDGIDYEAKAFGGFKVALRYKNLRAAADRARSLSVAN